MSRLKGEGRPARPFADRAAMLSALYVVDAVIGFAEDTPQSLIEAILPDVLAKGGDYRPEDVVGAQAVTEAGGEVRIIPLLVGHSTTGLLHPSN